MSNEQQQGAIDGTLQQYAVCETKLSKLQAEAAKFQVNLSQLSRGLASASTLTGPNGGATVAFIEQNIAGFPDADAILSLVSEIAGELDRKNVLYMRLSKMGFELKDQAD